MIKLKDALYVAADQVAEVSVPEGRDGLHVRMKDGRVHWVGCDYGKSAWDTAGRLIKAIDDERARDSGDKPHG